jgi:hypothetical protein
MEFRWNDWNLDHATQHGVVVEEIESLINGAMPPFPEYRGDGRWLVQGRGSAGRRDGSFRLYTWLMMMDRCM